MGGEQLTGSRANNSGQLNGSQSPEEANSREEERKQVRVDLNFKRLNYSSAGSSSEREAGEEAGLPPHLTS